MLVPNSFYVTQRKRLWETIVAAWIFIPSDYCLWNKNGWMCFLSSEMLPPRRFFFSFEERYSDLPFYLSLPVLASQSRADWLSWMVGLGMILKVAEGHDQSTFLERENVIILKRFLAITTVWVSLPIAMLPLCHSLKKKVGCIRKAYIFKKKLFPF